MARTAQNIIDELKANRFPWMTTAEGLQYLNDTHKDLIATMPPLRRLAFTAPITIVIVAGTREYILPLTTAQIERAEFTPTSGTAGRLAETSIETINKGLADGNPNSLWINQAQVASTEYYLAVHGDGLYVGLNPIPSVGGSLKLIGADLGATLVVGDQVLPIYSDEIYLEGVSYRLMKAKRRAGLAQGYYGIYESLKVNLRNWLLSFVESFENKDDMNASLK